MTYKPKILFVDQFGSMGGAQRVLLSLLRAAEKEDVGVSVLAPEGPLEEAVRDQFGGRVTYHRCEEPRLTHGVKRPGDVLALAAYAWRFRRHFALLKTQDVIYVNGLRHLPHMLFFALPLHARVIYHIHLGHSRAERWLIRLASRWPRTFRLVACSGFVAQRINAGKMSVIRNALDRTFAARPFTNRFDTPGWRFAVVGTLRPEKGQDIAIDAVKNRPGVILHLIGKDGDGAAAWIAGLKARKLPNVIFDGVASDVAARLEELKIQVSLVPSRWQEPFGLVTIESMACSCLTVVSGTGGLAEVAADTGALVAANPDELSATIDQVLAMSGDALAATARAQFEATQRIYEPERFEQEVQTLLHSALASGGSQNPAGGEQDDAISRKRAFS